MVQREHIFITVSMKGFNQNFVDKSREQILTIFSGQAYELKAI